MFPYNYLEFPKKIFINNYFLLTKCSKKLHIPNKVSILKVLSLSLSNFDKIKE